MFGFRRAIGQGGANSPAGCLKFIVDAQLPKRLAEWFRAQGHDCVHTKELPERNRTSDLEILRIAREEDRCIITKDSDFQMRFELGQGPKRLLLVSTGNLDNDRLIALFETHRDRVIEALAVNLFLELTRSSLIVHS